MKKGILPLRFLRYTGKPIRAKKDVPFEIRLQARLNLDVICFKYNRFKLEEAINSALKENNKEAFRELSEQYRQFIWK